MRGGNENGRLQLWPEGNCLVSDDGQHRVELTPQGLREGLESKEIVPSRLLYFLVLSCYYGLRCQGGFSQVTYLTQMKDAFMKLAAGLNDQESVTVAKATVTDELCGDIISAFIKKADGSVVPSTGIDWVLKGSEETWQKFAKQCRNLTLEEALSPIMPEFYRILYPEAERYPELTSITTEQIMELTGLTAKIEPCLEIS